MTYIVFDGTLNLTQRPVGIAYLGVYFISGSM